MDTLGSGIVAFIEGLLSLQKNVLEKGPQSVSFMEKIFSIVSLYLECPLSEVLLYNY